MNKVNFNYNETLFTDEDKQSLSAGRNAIIAMFAVDAVTKEQLGFDHNSMNQFIPYYCVLRELLPNRKLYSFPSLFIAAAFLAKHEIAVNLFNRDRKEFKFLLETYAGVARQAGLPLEFVLMEAKYNYDNGGGDWEEETY